MEFKVSQIVGEIVIFIFGVVVFFCCYGISFCCGGFDSIEFVVDVVGVLLEVLFCEV